jgi:ribose transport system substrate-binding protein
MLPSYRFPVVVSALACIALGGCTSSQPGSQGKYYLVATNIKLPYWQESMAGLGRAAAELNVSAEMVGPDTYEPREQHEEFQRILKKDPAGILISVGDRRLMRADIDSAIGRGIPVFTMDSDAEYSKRLLFIGTDNYKAGTLIATSVAKTLNGKGNVVVFTMPEQLNLVQRQNGLNDVFRSHPGIRVTRIVDMKGDPRVAFDTATEILQKPNQVDAFVCLEAIACAEIANVIERNKITGKLIVAMDTAPPTLEALKKGLISATVAQKPYTMAYVGLYMLHALNTSKPKALDPTWSEQPFSPIPTFVDTGVTLVDSDNVDTFLKASVNAGSSNTTASK